MVAIANGHTILCSHHSYHITISIVLVKLRLSSPLFQAPGSNTVWTQGWIEKCRSDAALSNPYPGDPITENQASTFDGVGFNENAICSTFLRCVLFQATGDHQTNLSSAASILAFITMTVGLLSNRIEDIVAIADENRMPPLLLAISSAVSFGGRFSDPTRLLCLNTTLAIFKRRRSDS